MTVLGIIVDIILFIIIAGNSVINYKMGLTRVIFNIFSSILAIILVFVLYRPVTNYVFNQTKMAQNIEHAIGEKLDEIIPENATKEFIKSDENELLKVFMSGTDSEFIQNTTDDVKLYIASNITYRIISIVVYLVLFAIVRVVLHILKNYVDFLADLPFIRVVNHTGGLVYGVIKGFFIVYVVLAVISLIMPVVSNTVIIRAIEESWIGSRMFYHNILLNVIFKFL